MDYLSLCEKSVDRWVVADGYLCAATRTSSQCRTGAHIVSVIQADKADHIPHSLHVTGAKRTLMPHYTGKHSAQ
jgi:hypothetical protein